MRARRSSVVLVLVLGFPGSAAPAGQEAAPLLERARKALGSAPKQDMLLEGHGRAHAAGIDGSLRVLLALDGAFRIELESKLPERTGFDGTTAWTRDRMGLERAIELEEADRAKVFAWVLSGHWTEARGVTVRELAAGGTPSLELAVVGTPMVMTLSIDASTHLPAQLAYLDDAGEVRWSFSEWREVGGRKLPHRWTFDEGSGLDTFEIESFQPRPRDASLFRASLQPPTDVHFDPEADAQLDVIRVASGHLLVEPWVEGGPVGMFIFDSGAGAMTIDPEVADELGLPELGEVVAVGVGGRTTASFRRGTHFQLGPLTLDDPLYVELDLGFLEPIFGHEVAGIVGYDLLARCVAEVETKTPYLALHDPAGFTLTGASWQDLTLNENTPCVRARFEGQREGLFRLDTGADGTLSFHAPAVRELGLLDGRKASTGTSGGVGGTAETREGKLEWFELAGHRFEKPSVTFSLAERGAFTDRYTTGNIGQEFLAPFRMVLDYPGDRIAFVPLGK